MTALAGRSRPTKQDQPARCQQRRRVFGASEFPGFALGGDHLPRQCCTSGEQRRVTGTRLVNRRKTTASQKINFAATWRMRWLLYVRVMDPKVVGEPMSELGFEKWGVLVALKNSKRVSNLALSVMAKSLNSERSTLT